MLLYTLWRDVEQGSFLLFWERFSTGLFLTKGNKMQEPGPAPPATHTKALQREAPQPYMICLPGHNGEISLQ